MMIRLSSDIKRLSEVYIYIYQKEAKLRNSPKFIGIVIQSNIRTIKPNTKYILDIAACQEELMYGTHISGFLIKTVPFFNTLYISHQSLYIGKRHFSSVHPAICIPHPHKLSYNR